MSTPPVGTLLTSCIAAAQSAVVEATDSWIELLVAELVHLYPNLRPQVQTCKEQVVLVFRHCRQIRIPACLHVDSSIATLRLQPADN